jgi:hypothetical protein
MHFLPGFIDAQTNRLQQLLRDLEPYRIPEMLGEQWEPRCFWGKSPCQKPFAFCKKFEGGGGGLFSCHFFLRFFLIAFLAVSLHDELKNSTEMFPKIRPEHLKKSQKKGRCPGK